jgi:hypothetical protein
MYSVLATELSPSKLRIIISLVTANKNINYVLSAIAHRLCQYFITLSVSQPSWYTHKCEFMSSSKKVRPSLCRLSQNSQFLDSLYSDLLNRFSPKSDNKSNQ